MPHKNTSAMLPLSFSPLGLKEEKSYNPNNVHLFFFFLKIKSHCTSSPKLNYLRRSYETIVFLVVSLIFLVVYETIVFTNERKKKSYEAIINMNYKMKYTPK